MISCFLASHTSTSQLFTSTPSDARHSTATPLTAQQEEEEALEKKPGEYEGYGKLGTLRIRR